MRRLYLTFLAVTLFLLVGSCSLDDDGVNFHYEPLQITSVEVPESFNQYQIYTIKVNMIRPDDCTLIEGFDVTSSDVTVRNVVAVGAILEKPDCQPVDQEVQDTFQFEVLYNEPYIFRFYTGKDEAGEAQFLEVEVPVN
ncbi:hypothetical protein [Maribacter halichondriae]|uniref:hypothetical protein n=1 Tax=Maribacter halichondriae TaxID=2980554 RepID=UPI00235A3702|nr:hypothetical protein [Maribacter sp. Hal144]